MAPKVIDTLDPGSHMEYLQFEESNAIAAEKTMDVEGNKRKSVEYQPFNTQSDNTDGLERNTKYRRIVDVPHANMLSGCSEVVTSRKKEQKSDVQQEQIQTKGSGACLLKFKIAQMTAHEVDQMKTAVYRNSSLKLLEINTLPPDCTQPLIAFITGEEMLQEVRSTTINDMSCLAVTKSCKQQQMFFYLRNDKTTYQHASVCLRDELRTFLNERSIPSALDINSNKLVLFITKEQKDNMHASLDDRIDSIRKSHGTIADAYEIRYLDHSFKVRNESGGGVCFPGSSVQFECSDGSHVPATAGALVKDDQGRMYVLSSCHGKKVYHSYLIESTESESRQKRREAKYVGEVYSSSPFLDACLMEIDDEALKGRCDPCVPGSKIALCGPYTGRTEDLQNKAVMKYGAKTKRTEGVVTYYEFELPSAAITNALIITPDQDCSSFTQEGDSGSVIFRRTPEKSQQQDCDIPHHEVLAMHSSAIRGYRPPVPTWSLPFRLDDVFRGCEQKLGRKIRLLEVETQI